MFAPLRIVVAALSLSVLSVPAAAFCTGDPLDGRLTGAEQEELAAAIVATPFAEGLIWQATKGDATITLAGTFHLADPRQDALLTVLSPLIESASRLLVEVTPEGEAALQRYLGENPDLLLLPDNGTLLGKVDPETWEAIKTAAADRQIPAVMAARFQPWYLTMSLSIPVCAMSDLMAGSRGLDFAIMDIAGDIGVPIEPVEDWQTALTLLRAGSFEEQVAMLELAVADPALQAEAMVTMTEDYFAGRVARIWEMSRISMRWSPGIDPDEAARIFDDFTFGLLVERNRAWLPVILSAVEETPHLMVAVGAAHLPGEDGVLRGLETAGWTITRLY